MSYQDLKNKDETGTDIAVRERVYLLFKSLPPIVLERLQPLVLQFYVLVLRWLLCRYKRVASGPSYTRIWFLTVWEILREGTLLIHKTPNYIECYKEILKINESWKF